MKINDDVYINEFISTFRRLNQTYDSKVQAVQTRANVAINQHRFFKATQHNCKELSSILKTFISELKQYRPSIKDRAKDLLALDEVVYELKWRCMMLDGEMAPIPTDAGELEISQEAAQVIANMSNLYSLSGDDDAIFNDLTKNDQLALRFLRNRFYKVPNSVKSEDVVLFRKITRCIADKTFLQWMKELQGLSLVSDVNSKEEE